jgi:hypothetical protein
LVLDIELSWKTTLELLFLNNLPSTFVWVVDIWIVEQSRFRLEKELKMKISISNKEEWHTTKLFPNCRNVGGQCCVHFMGFPCLAKEGAKIYKQ